MIQDHTLHQLSQSVNIPGFFLESIESEFECLTLHLKRKNHNARCSSCGKYCGKFYDSAQREFRDLDWGWGAVYLSIRRVRVICPRCGIRVERLPFALVNSSYTKRFGLYLAHMCRYMTRSDVAAHFGVSEDTVGRIEWETLEQEWFKMNQWTGVSRIRMDEIASSKGQSYMTVVTDVETGQVIDVVEGRTKSDLADCFQRISPQKREKIQWVCIDMSGSYKSAVKEWFPNAKIVFDRFHVVKHLNEALDEVRKFWKRKSKTTQREKWKHSKYALGKNPENLTPNQAEALEWIKLKKPELFMVYQMKEEFRSLWTYPSKRGAEIFLTRWLKKARDTGYQDMIKFCKMVENHREGIMNYYFEPLTNGPQEGLNNKLNVIRRKAYGYRNKDWFLLKIFQSTQQMIMV